MSGLKVPDEVVKALQKYNELLLSDEAIADSVHQVNLSISAESAHREREVKDEAKAYISAAIDHVLKAEER